MPERTATSRAECAFAVVERGLVAEGGDSERALQRAGILPRGLVSRPFSPNFDPIVAKVGVAMTRTRPVAGAFAGLLREEAAQERRHETGPARSGLRSV